jgi:hypothetical protein
VNYLSDRMQNQLFAGVQGGRVTTQDDEVKRRQAELRQAVQGNDEEKRKKLEAILVPLAVTLGDREELRREIHEAKIDDLMKPDGPFESAFKEALSNVPQPGTGAEIGSQKRQAIAHLLIGTSQTPADYQRAMVVVGATNYVRELESQASALAAMTPELQLTIASDRSAFEVEHKAIVEQIIALAERVRDAEENISNQRELLEKHKGLVEKRRNDVADLQKRIADAKLVTAAELATQSDLENQLFKADAKVAAEEHKNQRLEREIKARELGSEGGK